MFGKNLLFYFYFVASTVIAGVAQVLGANIGIVLRRIPGTAGHTPHAGGDAVQQMALSEGITVRTMAWLQ